MVDAADKPNPQGFVHANTDGDAMIYTDEARAYDGLRRRHEAVKHSVGEYVRDIAHTNGVESFWAMLKRGYAGVYHHMSVKHLERYASEFSGWRNSRPLDTERRMRASTRGMEGKRLRYADLIADEPRLL